MASLSLYPWLETNLISNRKVIELLLQLKSAKGHGKNYIKVKPHLVSHHLRNCLLAQRLLHQPGIENERFSFSPVEKNWLLWIEVCDFEWNWKISHTSRDKIYKNIFIFHNWRPIVWEKNTAFSTTYKCMSFCSNFHSWTGTLIYSWHYFWQNWNFLLQYWYPGSEVPPKSRPLDERAKWAKEGNLWSTQTILSFWALSELIDRRLNSIVHNPHSGQRSCNVNWGSFDNRKWSAAAMNYLLIIL